MAASHLRRAVLVSAFGAGAGCLGWTAWPSSGPAPAVSHDPLMDPRMGLRRIGSPDAPVAVHEYFSLTCPHCAAFATDALPRVQSELLDRGLASYAFEYFPVDGYALAAAAVARSVSPDRYVPFVLDLLASQTAWSSVAAAGLTEALAVRAAPFGLDRDGVASALADRSLAEALVRARTASANSPGVRGTPTFSFNGALAVGDLSFSAFSARVAAARRA